MPVVFAEVTNALVGIEENVFVPVVGDSLNHSAAPLEADDFVVRAAELAARAKRNERLDFAYGGFELLKNREGGIFGVQDGSAVSGNDRYGLPERSSLDGRAALRTIQPFRLRRGRPRT